MLIPIYLIGCMAFLYCAFVPYVPLDYNPSVGIPVSALCFFVVSVWAWPPSHLCLQEVSKRLRMYH